MRQPRFNKTVVRRMSYIHGQARGILKMMHENRSYFDVLIQLFAAKAAIETLIYPHFDSDLRCDLLQRIETLPKSKIYPPKQPPASTTSGSDSPPAPPNKSPASDTNSPSSNKPQLITETIK